MTRHFNSVMIICSLVMCSAIFLSCGIKNGLATNTIFGALHNIAVNPVTHSIFVSDLSKIVGVINGTTNSVVKSLDTGELPIAIAVNPSTNIIYVANAGSNSTSVIDGKTNSVVKNIRLAGSPNSIAVNPNTNMVYVSLTGINPSLIDIIDGKTNSVVKSLKIPGSSGILGGDISLNPITNIVYVLAHNVYVIDGKTNSVVKNIRLAGSPNSIAVNPNTNMVYIVNGQEGALDVIDGKTNSEVKKQDLNGKPEYALAIDPTRDLIYVGDSSPGIFVVDGKTNNLVKVFGIPFKFLTGLTVTGPGNIAVDPSANKIYRIINGLNLTAVIDGRSNNLINMISNK